MDFLNALQRVWDWFRARFDSGYGGGLASESGIMERREKVTVFIISLIIALVMWVVVNLGRDLNTTVQFQLTIGELPDNQALASDLPEQVTATVSGEGWRLLPLRSNVQTIAIDISQPEVLLADMIREKIGATGVNVLAVQPAILRTALEERISKKVPVVVRHELEFRGQYNIVGELRASPDSVTITGARSIVEGIQNWPTTSLVITGINSDIRESVPLEHMPIIMKPDVTEVTVTAKVSEFTEGEQRVRIEVSDLPFGSEVNFDPAYLTIRYTIPIEEYAISQSEPMFSAIVPYVDLRADSTGYISPMITTLSDTLHAAVRSVQPRRVSYFEVIR